VTTQQLPAAFDRPPEGPRPGLDAAIEFVNTTGLSRGKPFEDLASADDAVHWLHAAGFLSHESALAEHKRFLRDPRAADDALRRARSTRAGLRELVDALAEEREPRADAIAAVNGALRVEETAQLVLAGSRLRVAFRRSGEPFDQALATIARLVADELSEGRPERFRVCENDTCRWAFYDRSRPATRRWCEMASCGNRMKAARHRARQREAAAQAAAPDEDASAGQ
jgi:predicted RNA-binding Zn ribbon-like protein